MNAALVLVRATQFAASLLLVGLFAFRRWAGAPAFGAAAGAGTAVDGRAYARTLEGLTWAALAAALVSAALWLVLEASWMGGQPVSAAVRGGILTAVLLHTQGGHAWLVRGALLLLLALVLGRRRGGAPPAGSPRGGLTLAGAAAATLVFAGHAGAARGGTGALQQACDAVHLLAAGAWLGGLVPLALLLAAAQRAGDEAWLRVARAAATRFSALALGCVASLVATGLVASWFLVGSAAGLFGSAYGWWLLLKLGLFAAMLAVAAWSRGQLLPRLAPRSAGAAREAVPHALAALYRSCVAEACLGLLVLVVVGQLGVLPPAAEGSGAGDLAPRGGAAGLPLASPGVPDPR